MKKILLSSLLVLSLVGTSRATAVILWYAGNKAILATDSLIMDVADGGEHPSSPTCKLHRTGNLAMMVQGTLPGGMSEGFAVFDQAARKSSNPLTVLNAFGAVVAPALARAVRAMKINNPTAYRENFKPGFDALRVFVAGVRNAEVFFYVRTFGLSRDGRSITQKTETCNNCLRIEAGAKAEQFARANLRLIGTAVGMEALLSIAAGEYPGKVAPPYSILEITSTGPQWLQRGLCTAN